MKNLRLLSLAMVAALLGSGCGSPGVSNQNALQSITAASAKTNGAGTANVEMQMTMEMMGQSIDIAATGAMDIDKQLAHMTMTMNMGSGAPSMAEIEMITDGLMIYTKYPPEMAASMPGDKPWMLIDMQVVGEAQGMDLGAMAQTSGGDPSQILQYLNGVTEEIETVGEEEIRGVATTHYKAIVDFNKAADQAPAHLKEAVRASIEAMQKQLGTSESPVDVWVGEDGYVHRMMMSFESDEGAQGPFSMQMTMDLFDFGTPVKIQFPPTSQVYDMTEMMAGMGASATP